MNVTARQHRGSRTLIAAPAVWQKLWLQQTVLFVVCLLVLLQTMAPTIYYLVDSAEYAIGASVLGIVHAPGYPLYLTVARLFTALPFGDVAYRVNLLSVVCLALTAAFFYGMTVTLLRERLAAAGATLTLVWSYYVWLTGIAAEVYAPQLASLSALGWALATCYRHPTTRVALLAGILFGIAVAANPSSVFFAPGMALAFRLARVPWRTSIAGGVLAVTCFAASLLYFPLRYAAQPEFNAAGMYAADGSFQPVDLGTLNGIWWMLRGAQFAGFFFSEGFLPSMRQIGEVVSYFWGNFLGVGFITGLVGAAVLWKKSRRLLAVWFAGFVPYTYFYTTYGAADRETMLGPSFMLWSVLIAFGVQWFTASASKWWKYAAIAALPATMLLVNSPIVDASQITGVRERAETVINAMPQNAVVFGNWLDIITLQYLQIVERRRPDLQLYNVYYFPNADFFAYLDLLVEHSDKPLIVLSEELDNHDRANTLHASYALQPLPASDTAALIAGYRIVRARP